VTRRARPRALAALAAGLVLTAGACGSPATTTAPAPHVVPPPPLDTSLATGGGTVAVVAMGQLGQPGETFWQLFVLSGPDGRWVLRTPPGVADNGGLVAATSGATTVVGFRPTDLLAFSPLAITADAGVHYSTSVIPSGLTATPGALSLSGPGTGAALAGSGVLSGSEGLAVWRPVVTARALSASPAAIGCRPGALTAVTGTGAGLLVGTSCERAGSVGLYRLDGAAVAAAGLRLPVADAGGRVAVVRLASYRHGAAALVTIGTGPSTRLVAAWEPATGSPWRLSAPWAAGAAVQAAGVTAGGGFAVSTRSGAGVIAPGAPWRHLPAPPAGTATLAVTGERVDALTVKVTQMTDYRLTGGRWEPVQTTRVPITFGASS
jgi:hypothetical protein